MGSKFYAIMDTSTGRDTIINVIEVFEGETFYPPGRDFKWRAVELPGGSDSERGWSWSAETGHFEGVIPADQPATIVATLNPFSADLGADI